MKKKQAEPRPIAARADRGTSREPDGLRRFRRGETGYCGVTGPLPHGRFCLGFEVRCERPFTGPDEVRVPQLYAGLLPLLVLDLVSPATRPQWIDFVALIDELMAREDELFAARVPWPLAEVAAICGEAAGLLELEPDNGRYAPEELRALFVGLHAGLAAHRWCCYEVHVNVHWW